MRIAANVSLHVISVHPAHNSVLTEKIIASLLGRIVTVDSDRVEVFYSQGYRRMESPEQKLADELLPIERIFDPDVGVLECPHIPEKLFRRQVDELRCVCTRRALSRSRH